MKRVVPEPSPTDINSENRKPLNIHFVTELLSDMKGTTIAIFIDGNHLTNPGPAGAGAVIFRPGMNKPPLNLGCFLNSTNYHGEIDVILQSLEHILSAQSKVSANTIHIFTDSIAAINCHYTTFPIRNTS